ncbi:MAG: ribosome assembly factor SBDS [Nanoarchaeota archaeon]
MVSVDKSFEVKYKKKDNQFEVLVDFDNLQKFKKNPQELSVYDVLVDYKIFKDQKKGEVASSNLLKIVFPEMQEEEILKEILLKGECQIPTSYLNKLREQKKEQVINYIVESAINPVTKTKYTSSMIKGVVDKLNYNFNANTSYTQQAEEVLKLLKPKMPISIDKVKFNISIPPQYIGSFYGPFRKIGEIKKEYYDKNSNLVIEIVINQGKKDELIEYIKRHTNNEASYYKEL